MPIGARSDRTYALSVQQVQLTIGGSPVDLDRLSGATLTVNANVADLDVGVHEVTLTISVQAGLNVIAIAPATVTVTIGATHSVGRPTAVGRRLTMARLFGTDGIRGVANVELKPTLAYALGRATAHQLVGKGGQLVVGQDTRRSGDMFVAAITAGATSLGADVRIAGCVPTPALAYPGRDRRVRRRDHGLGVAQPGRGQRPQGPRSPGAQARRRDRGGDRAAHLAERGARLGRQRGDRPVGRRPEPARPLPPASAGAGRRDRCDRPPDRPRLRQRVGRRGRAGDPRRDRGERRGDPQRSRRDQHQRRIRGDLARLAGRGGSRARRRRRVRPRRRRRPPDRGRRDGPDRRRRPGPRDPGPRPDRARRPRPRARSSSRSSRTAGSRRRSRRPAGT